MIPLGLIIFVLLVVYNLNKLESSQPNVDRDEYNNPFNDLRDIALTITSEQIGLENNEAIGVWGIVMDWHVGDGIATIPAFKTGDASMYLSSGGGVIGGVEHENVRMAVAKFIETGQDFLSRADKVEETPLPNENMINFYFLTNEGTFLGQESMTNIENGKSIWLKLFEAGNDVITELRIIDERMNDIESE